MKLSEKKTTFEPCPEYTGPAVCVDVTPLKKVNTQYGEREVFRLVFEIDEEREDGSRWCVWSQGFTPSLHEKAGLRKFLRGWFGRDLTEGERELFDTESLIGKPAFLVIVHNTKDDQVFANIASCTPHKSGHPMSPSGRYVRVQDREKNGAGDGGGKDASYKRTEAPRQAARHADAEEPTQPGSFLTTKVHVGRHRGCELRELSEESVEKLVEHWLPTAKANAKPTADDRRLIAALEWFVEQKQAATVAAADDDIPY